VGLQADRQVGGRGGGQVGGQVGRWAGRWGVGLDTFDYIWYVFVIMIRSCWTVLHGVERRLRRASKIKICSWSTRNKVGNLPLGILASWYCSHALATSIPVLVPRKTGAWYIVMYKGMQSQPTS